ncbi:hypothetical protein FB107DRAFT_206454 [Schizophyllum commune]
MSVKRRSTHSLFAAVFRRASGSHHDDLNPHEHCTTAATSHPREEGPSTSSWTSPHDGWRRRAMLVQDSTLPTNLSSSNLIFAVTSSGMIGDSVWLAVFATREASPSLDESGHHTASSGDDAEEQYAMPPTTRSDAKEHTDYTHDHIAIDASGRVWRLDQKDSIAFLDLVKAARTETSVIADFHVAHTVTCQPTVHLVLSAGGAGADVQDSSRVPALRTVGVSAYSKHYRRLETATLGKKGDKQVRSAQKELPAALYEVLGLAQEGIEGFRDSDTNVTALLTVKNALPRSLLSSMYIPPGHASP